MKRSALVRKAPGRAELTVKPRKCRQCRSDFFPTKAKQVVCTPACAAALVAAKNARKTEKQRKAAEKLARDTDTAKREAMKRVPDLKAEAQEAVNAYVRWRDQGKGCFVCGTLLTIGGVGGGFDAGHIRSRSQADHLRFDAQRNIFGQCKPCNAPGSTKDHVMRAAAERLLGKDVADALYADNRVIKWTREGLRAIRDDYRAKLKAMKSPQPSPDSGAYLGACCL